MPGPGVCPLGPFRSLREEAFLRICVVQYIIRAQGRATGQALPQLTQLPEGQAAERRALGPVPGNAYPRPHPALAVQLREVNRPVCGAGQPGPDNDLLSSLHTSRCIRERLLFLYVWHRETMN